MNGSLSITTTSIGSAIDVDGYTVLLDGIETATIGASDSVAAVVAVGTYDLALAGLADNCAVIGGNPAPISIVSERISRVDFDVACPPFFDYIAFASSRDGSSDIFVMEPDGSNPTNLVSDTLWLDARPAWSPDGTRIAFDRTSADQETVDDLFILDTSSMSFRRLTNGRKTGGCSWAPDGVRLVYHDFTECPGDACYDIYVINSDGTGAVNLTPGPAAGYDPAWSPDGDQIVFARDNIWLMQADGSDAGSITNFESSVLVSDPAWSPDGMQIVFVRGGGEDLADNNIWVMDSNGSNLHRLTEDVPGYQAWNPSWSSDGSRITYWAYRPEDEYCYQIYVMDADGANPTNITNHDSCNTGPDWSPGR